MKVCNFDMPIKRVALIRPGRYPEGLIVPLGLLYLAGYLKSKIPDTDIRIVDAAIDNLELNDIVRRIKVFNPEIIGLTGLSVHANCIKETARSIRKILPKAIIIAGGPAATSNCEELLAEQSIDLVVIGEGEETFYEIVKCLQERNNLGLIDGLVYKNQQGRVIFNKERKVIEDLDRIPYPAYHLISVESFFNSSKRNSQSPIYISKRNMPILTSRGCPYKCIFCHKTLGKTFRPRSPQNVLGEIIWLKQKFNIRELEIIDDIFNFDKQRAKDIMKKIIAANLDLKISFPNGIKYEMIDDELLELFKNAGVYRLAFGIESGNHRIQKIIRKTVNLDKMRDIIRKSSKIGFVTSGFFQLGIPSETEKEMLDTINFAVSSSLHTAMFHLTMPFPGTQIYEEYIRGKVKDVNFVSAREISINLSAVSDRKLLKIKRYAFLKFYFDLKRVTSIYSVFPVKKRLFYNFINVISEILFKKWIIQT